MSQLEHIEAIERRLWSAADTLRANSSYASNEYFLPVMGLIFLRHAYSRYLAVKDVIVASLPSRGGVSSLYIYYALLHTTFISTDVAVPGLNRNYAHSCQVLIPDDSLLRLFEESVSPMHRQMDVLRRQNDVLTNARDLLLPRLMNGEIEV